MNRHWIVATLSVVMMLGLFADSAQAEGEGYMELVSATPIVYEGTNAWEYYYDVYSGGLGSATQIWLEGFDANDILNPLNQRWDSSAADGWGESQWGEFPSIGDGDPDGTDQWVLTGNTGAMLNPIHSPSEYLVNEGMDWAFMYAGSVTAENELHYWYGSTAQYIEGLYMTIRLVHPLGPGDISYSIYGPFYWDQQNVTIIGPAAAAVRDGDFTDDLGGGPDDIVDAYDIDALADAILNGGDVATFDLVIDGVLDSLDMDMLIASLVDTDLGLATGSFYGDFNLDGTVDLLDLNKLTANYNGFGGWTLGDANGDGAIALLDLNKLTANYNSTVTVPEPATMFVMACGAAALIRRRRRA
jgi:hypothetical protein